MTEEKASLWQNTWEFKPTPTHVCYDIKDITYTIHGTLTQTNPIKLRPWRFNKRFLFI